MFPLSSNLCSIALSCDITLHQQTVQFANTTLDVLSYILQNILSLCPNPKTEEILSLKSLLRLCRSPLHRERKVTATQKHKKGRKNIWYNGRRGKTLELSKQKPVIQIGWDMIEREETLTR